VVRMILIAPYAKQLRNGKRNPKNYPFWEEVIRLLAGKEIVQVGISGEEPLVEDVRMDLPIAELRGILKACDTWIACDSFFQHLGWDEGKPGVVLWSVSDPLIFGHSENINLLKNRDCLAANQFLWWEQTEYDASKFVEPSVVVEAVDSLMP
ncbi:MAG: hypothetical protein EBR82_45745, partial [Caulobacteraceae bacterium]|nr:hypothetical protein [Caulobacteraceae bacterium]